MLAFAKRREHAGRFADPVREAADGHFGVVERVGHTGDYCLFHAFLFLSYESAGGVGEAGAYPEGHVEPAGDLDAAEHHDFGAAGGEFQHLVVGYEVELAGFGDDTRVGGVDPVHVREDLAGLGSEGRGQRDGGGVGAAAAEGGDVVLGGDSLEAGHQDDLVVREGLDDALGLDVEDLGLGMRGVGEDAGLRAGERDGVVAQLVDGHDHQSRGDALAGGEEHVHLAGGRVGRDLLGHFDEIVGRVAARGDHGHDRVPLFSSVDDPLSHPFHAGGISHRRPSELHHDDVRALGLAFRSADDDVLGAEGVFRGWDPAGGGLLFFRHVDQCSALWLQVDE